MNDSQKHYYRAMLERNRGHIFLNEGHVAGVVTFLIGDDDEKYLYNRMPWTLIDDDPDGKTIYVDQLLFKSEKPVRYVHRETARFFKWAQETFPKLQRAKWVRVNAAFRKHGIKEGVKSNVYCKSFKS